MRLDPFERPKMKFAIWIVSLFSMITLGVSMSHSQNQPPIRFVVFHKPGPSWQQGIDFRQQPGVQDHVQHYLKFYEDGKLALGGPFLDNSGGMMVPTPDVSLEDMKAFAESDPAVKSGLLIVEIKPWMTAMEK